MAPPAARGSTGARWAALTTASTTSQSPTIRPARADDAAAIAAIHNQGIEERVATFETDPRRAEDVAARIESGELLLVAAAERGLHKLVGRLFTSNEPSVALFRRQGFREVGVHRRHSKLDGRWRDVLLVERLVGDAAAG